MCEIKWKEKKKNLDKFPLHRTENSQKAFSCKLKGYDSPKFVENVWNLKTARDQLAAVEMEKWIHGNVSDKVGYKKDEIVFGLFACYDWQVHNETEHKDNKKGL